MVHDCVVLCNYALVPCEKAGCFFMNRTITVESDG